MTDSNDYDDNTEDLAVDDDEAKAAEKGAAASDSTVSDADLAEAETLTVTAKKRQWQALVYEGVACLARGVKISEVLTYESAKG